MQKWPKKNVPVRLFDSEEDTIFFLLFTFKDWISNLTWCVILLIKKILVAWITVTITRPLIKSGNESLFFVFFFFSDLGAFTFPGQYKILVNFPTAQNLVKIIPSISFSSAFEKFAQKPALPVVLKQGFFCAFWTQVKSKFLSNSSRFFYLTPKFHPNLGQILLKKLLKIIPSEPKNGLNQERKLSNWLEKMV